MIIPPLENILSFKGQGVVVTGSSRGIGRGIALRFAEAGANVVVHCNSDLAKAESVANEIRKMGSKAYVIKADVSKSQDVESLAEQALACLNRLDVWINNAGIYPTVPLLQMTENAWDEMISTNLRSVFLCTQTAAKLMIAHNTSGAIINITSIEASFPAPEHSHYNASKAGVLMFTKSTARELAPYQIRVNAVSPGLIWTPGIEENWPQGVNAWKKTVPMTRLGQPEDIADACLFLASPAARWITGIDLVVDGGASTTPAF